MKKDLIVKWFFGWMLGFGLLILLIWISSPPQHATGIPHPEFKSMQKSGESVASLPASKYLSYAFGLGIMGILGFALFTGALKSSKGTNQQINRRLTKWLVFGMLAYMLVYSITVWVYWQDISGIATHYVLGFPMPTSWMLYGIGSVPLIFSLIYILKFHQWVLTPEEQQQFDRIVEERHKRDSST